MLDTKSEFSPGEVALLCGVSTKTVLRAIKRGDLVAMRFGPRTHRITRRDLNSWVELSKGRARGRLAPVVSLVSLRSSSGR